MRFVLYFMLICSLLFTSKIDSLATQVLWFKAVDANTNLPLKLDSIQVQDITNKTYKTITVDSIDLDYYVMGADDNSPDYSSFVKLNSANPFEYQTSFTVYESNPSNVTFRLFDLLGNIVLTKSQYLENGVHNFNLDLGGLNAGNYYLNIKDDVKQNQLKLIKIGKSNGLANTLEFKGTEKLEVVYQKSKYNSIQSNNHTFSFKCFKSGYHYINYSNYSIINYQANRENNFTFPLQKNYNYNYNSMTLVSSKIKIIRTKSSYAYVGGGTESQTSDYESYIQFNDFNFNNYPVYDQVYYLVRNVPILGCPNLTNDSLRFNLCNFNDNFSGNASNDAKSYSRITDIKFNKDSNYLDFMNYKYTINSYKFDYNNRDGTYIGSDSYEIFFKNVSYTLENNNLIILLNSKAIKKSVIFKSSSSLDWHSPASHFSKSSDSIKEVLTIPDDAFIKLTLYP